MNSRKDDRSHVASEAPHSGRAGRSLLWATAALLALLLSGHVLAQANNTPDVLRLGVYSYIVDTLPFDELIAEFEANNPGITVEVTSIPGTEIADTPAVVQKYALEARRNKATYDAILGPTPWIEVAPLADAGAIEPLDDYIPEDVLAAMPDAVRDGNTYQGQLYTVPFWADVVNFIYRTDYLEQATGSSEPPQTWEEVISTSEAIEAEFGEEVAGFGADWTLAHRLFLPLLVTLTDEPFTEEGLFNLEDDAAVETLKWIQRLHPYMPANAQRDLGSSQTFQAGRLAMELYWPAQIGRAVQAGVPADALASTSNPRNEYDSTIFWTTGMVVLSASDNKQEAVDFLVEEILRNPQALDVSFTLRKIVPYEFVEEHVGNLDWYEPLKPHLESGQAIPMNSYFLNIERPIYEDEVQKMILRGQSPEETRDNMLRRINEQVND